MSTINRIAAAVIAVGAIAASPVLAQDVSYPRSVGTGENSSVEYGPAGSSNIVGGGRVAVQYNSRGEGSVSYLDQTTAQAPRAGQVPVQVGTGENSETVWVPATGNAYMTRLQAFGARG
ncbi:hypothetical protein G3576_13055 [Roseomonas stagni]|uniref:Uncharacterized protein n=1 Tax=Falsiroseomonas algicola TaxID=2716930 RepID=A0A6M1LKU4_9PROT|nr:hypothetical protein [Falsiroseomonas algicola]NGM20948.1 hypothetical protein [Falsiroseomonas algicola]